MDSAKRSRLIALAEGEESPDVDNSENGELDSTAEDEVRSAAHAVLGGSLGQQIYDSVFAGDLVDMAERLAKSHNVKPAAVLPALKDTMARWRYVTKMVLSDGSTVSIGCRLEVQ